MRMSHRRGVSRTLIGELVALLIAAPPIFFANWFPGWAPYLGLALLAGSWLWRRVRMGRWWVSTPADWPLWFLFGVMLPVSVLVAPDPLREQYSLSRALIMVWNFSLFSTVAVHASTRRSSFRLLTYGLLIAGAAITLLAPLGINWVSKFPALAPILGRIPAVFQGVFAGAESGFSPNQVAGALLYVLPLTIAFTLYAPAEQRFRRASWWIVGGLALLMTGVLVLTQSRGGLLGFGVALLAMLLLPLRWGRWLLMGGTALIVLAAPFWFDPALALMGGVEVAGGDIDVNTLASRQEIWTRALYGIQDFSFTGMGLGTFRAVMPLLYPMFTVAPDVDLAHAHNFFLQTALDFGVPGLVALLAMYLVAVVQIVALWRMPAHDTRSLPLRAPWRTWAIGIAGALIAQIVYSQFDAVAMGARPNFLHWYLFSMTYAVANLAERYAQGSFERRRVQRGERTVSSTPGSTAAEPVGPPLMPAPAASQAGEPVPVAAMPASAAANAAASPRRRRTKQEVKPRGRLLLIGAGGVLLALLLLYAVRLAVIGWQTVQSAQDLRSGAAQIDTDPAGAIAALRSELPQLAENLAALHTTLAPAAPFLGLLRGLPGYGYAAATAPELADLGADGVALAADLLAAGTANAAPADLATLLAQAGPRLPEFTGRMAALETRLAQVNAAAMPAPLDTLLQQGASLLKLAQVGMELGPQMPWLLGMDEPRHYLVLVQNNHELRATGGFISSVGLLTVEQGKIANLSFADSYEFYRDGGQYPLAPEPMKQYMGIQLMLLRDANWWPDFPASAEMARKLYGEHTGIFPDGVITVDLNAVQHLVGALGTVQVPGSATPITADNLEAQLISFWDQPLDDGAGPPPDFQGNRAEWFAARKDFIPLLAETVMQRIQAGDASLPALAQAVQAALEDRSVQVWLNDETAAPVLAQAGWDGGLQPAEGADFLAIVDTNMGYNKVNAVLEPSADYRIEWGENPDQGALATLTLVYNHPGPAGDPTCDPAPRYGDTYADMMARCYFDYVRVFAPAGSRLLNVEGVDPETVTISQETPGVSEFAAYFVLPTESAKTITFTYRLPPGLTKADYQLVAQRQAGAPPLPVRLTLDGEQEEFTVAEGRFEWSMTP